MTVNYICKHCKSSMGTILHQEMSEQQLGFHYLTPEERKDIITYHSNGDITVQMVCEYCNEALYHNPELMLIDSPLQ